MLFLASSAAAQGGFADQRAEAKVTVDPAGENFTFSQDVAGDPGRTVDLECRGGAFTPLSQGFLFLSEQGRAACGEAGWTLEVPVDAALLDVSFSADRRISSRTEQDQVEAVQELTVFDQGGRVLSHQELFPPFNGSSGDTRFDVQVALTPSVREVFLLWHMEDKGSRVPDTTMTLPVGAEFHAEVTDVRAVFDAVPVPGVQGVEHEDERRGDQIVRSRDVRFQVPNAWTLQEARNVDVEVRLEVRGGYGPTLLVLPGGGTMSAHGFRLDPEDQGPDGSVVMVVPSSLLGAGGTGTYTMRMEDSGPAAALVPGGTVAGLLILGVPAATMVLAGRALSGHRSRGGFSYRAFRYGIPAFAVLFMAMVFVWAQGQGGVGLLATRVMVLEVWWLYAGVAVAFTVAVAVLVVEHKYSHRLRARDWLRAHQELLRERRDREQAEAALYAVAHDMKSPLLVLDHLVQDVGDMAADEGQRRDSLERSLLVVAQIQNMVQDVLDYAVHTGEASGHGKTWIRPVVDQVVQTLRHSTDRGNVRFVVDGKEDACLLGPSEALHSVLTNLVCNAVKYSSHEDAVVRVSVRPQVAHKKRGLVLEVADNGPGVPQSDRERVFDFLTRLPDRKGRNVPGTGVGLAIVKRVVQEQGGKVEVDDAPEGGALFRVVWPPERVGRWRPMEASVEKTQARIHQNKGRGENVEGLSKWVEGVRSDPSVTGTV